MPVCQIEPCAGGLAAPLTPLPAMRVGRKIPVRRSEFDRWLEAHEVKHLDVGCIVDELIAAAKGERLMGVKVRKKGNRRYVVVDYHGHRKSKCVGSREATEYVKRQVEAKLALGDLGVLDAAEDKRPTTIRSSSRGADRVASRRARCLAMGGCPNRGG